MRSRNCVAHSVRNATRALKVEPSEFCNCLGTPSAEVRGTDTLFEPPCKPVETVFLTAIGPVQRHRKGKLLRAWLREEKMKRLFSVLLGPASARLITSAPHFTAL
jgi:hypothetical protein